jgi:hypothetical protein
MAKRSKSKRQSNGTIRKADLAQILRAIETMKDGDTPGPLAAAAALRASERARNQALRRKVGALLVNKAEIGNAEALIAQYNKESAALRRKETAAARKLFLSSSKRLRAHTVSPLEAATSAHFTEFGGRSATVLLQPIATVARPTGMLWDTQALGATGLAKIYFSDDRQGSDTLTLEFWYTWVNAAADQVRVDVNCPVAFSGECSTHADIGLFFGGESGMQIDVMLDTYEWWKAGHPKAFPTYTSDTRQMLLNERTEAGGVWGDNAQEIYQIGQYQRLRYGTLVVPPGGRVMTRVTVQLYYDISGRGGFLGGGYVSFDFASKPTYAIIPTMMLQVTSLIPPLDPNP